MAWPTERADKALMCIDFMNVNLAQKHTFQGTCTDVNALLRSCLARAREVAEHPVLLVYLRRESLIRRRPEDAQVFDETCAELGICVQDVRARRAGPKSDDPVDIRIRTDMDLLNAQVDAATPFILASADKGFVPIVEKVREKRPVYVVVAMAANIPSLVHAATGWRWASEEGWLLLAMRDALRDFYPERMTMPQYKSARRHLSHILPSLHSGDRLYSPLELWPRDLWEVDVEKLPTMDELRLYADALVYYGVLEPQRKGYRVRSLREWTPPSVS